MVRIISKLTEQCGLLGGDSASYMGEGSNAGP